MSVRWVGSEAAVTAGLATIAAGGLVLITSGFLDNGAIGLGGGVVAAVGGVAVLLGRWPQRAPMGAAPGTVEPALESAEPLGPTPSILEPIPDAAPTFELPVPRTLDGAGGSGPAASGHAVAADVVAPSPDALSEPSAPPLVPEEPPWPPGPSTEPPPEGPTGPTSAPAFAPGTTPWILGPVSEAQPSRLPAGGPPSPSPLGPWGPEPPEELPGLAALPAGGAPNGSEPMAEPDGSPTVKWGGPSLPFAAATDRSQAIRGLGGRTAETWPPALDRGEEDLREEVERLRQRVEELSTPVLVPGFTVLPAPIRRDALGLVTRVPEPPTASMRPPSLCSACGDADLPGPSGGNRCWGCGRSVCANCFWRYGPGPALHRCASCAGKSTALTISGGRRSWSPGAALSASDEPEWSEGL